MKKIDGAAVDVGASVIDVFGIFVKVDDVIVDGLLLELLLYSLLLMMPCLLLLKKFESEEK